MRPGGLSSLVSKRKSHRRSRRADYELIITRYLVTQALDGSFGFLSLGHRKKLRQMVRDPNEISKLCDAESKFASNLSVEFFKSRAEVSAVLSVSQHTYHTRTHALIRTTRYSTNTMNTRMNLLFFFMVATAIATNDNAAVNLLGIDGGTPNILYNFLASSPALVKR